MIEPSHPALAIDRQRYLVGISWSAYLAPTRGESALILALIDRQFVETPW